jgi:hypothetical protein
MLEMIIRSSLNIVDRTERLIDNVRRLIGGGSLDEVEAYQVYIEIERLMDVVFIIDEATHLLRRTLEVRPETARRYIGRPTLH